jgi:hypothetical protein
VICLALAIILSIDVSAFGEFVSASAHVLDIKSPGDQSIQVFSMVITLVTIGSVVVTVNAKLLGGRVSFFQSLVRVFLQSFIHFQRNFKDLYGISAFWDTVYSRY